MISLLLAIAAIQEAPAEPITVAARNFGSCMEARIPAVPATVTPEAGAADVLKQCEAERAALVGAVESTIAAAPPEQQAAARERLTIGLERNRLRVAEQIKASRAASPKSGR